jgi:methionine-rich copper-binding protein CopC
MAVDADGDGVNDAVENEAPEGEDDNSDGILDLRQGDVASLPNAVAGQYVTLISPADTSLVDLAASRIKLDATDHVFGEFAHLLAYGSTNNSVEIHSGRAEKTDLSSEVVRADNRISIDAHRSAVDLTMSSLGITSGTRGDSRLEAQEIDVDLATILAPDRLLLSVPPKGTPLKLGAAP